LCVSIERDSTDSPSCIDTLCNAMSLWMVIVLSSSSGGETIAHTDHHNTIIDLLVHIRRKWNRSILMFAHIHTYTHNSNTHNTFRGVFLYIILDREMREREGEDTNTHTQPNTTTSFNTHVPHVSQTQMLVDWTELALYRHFQCQRCSFVLSYARIYMHMAYN